MNRLSSRARRLYVVAVSHLDTQWRWTLRDTIARHLPKTLRENFDRFERFPAYILSFDGAFRYGLMQEYFPAQFVRLKHAVRNGRWAPVGSMLDAADVNLPSPESLIRQILYGNDWFNQELAVRCSEIFLPDCFGFGFAFPSVAAHCGLQGFSSQKLSRGRGAIEIPFAVGVWEGPDGRQILAALEPGGYGEPLQVDLSRDPAWCAAIDRQGNASGAYVGLAYYGVGDTGGALDPSSLARLEAASRAPHAAIEVIPAAAGRLFQDLLAEQVARLPRYRGELLLSVHATGCYTSQAAMKRWNRQNEQLGQAAEAAAVAASWLTGEDSGASALTTAWQRFLVHQFHDDLPGTSLPSAYQLSWNDEVLSLNQFADLLATSVGVVADGLDTRVEGAPLVVFNAVAQEREDLVEVELPSSPADADRVFAVFDGDRQLPTNQQPCLNGLRLRFPVRMEGCGFKVLAARQVLDAQPQGELICRARGIENACYRVDLDESGDIASVFDKRLGRELLAAPLSLQLLPNRSPRFPAWEIQYSDICSPAGTFPGAASIGLVEQGPAAVALGVTREVLGTRCTATIRLASGAAGARLEVELAIDWRTRGRLLKAAFPLAVESARATYDLGLGTVERGVNTPRLYEVPAQQWAHLAAGDGSWGVAVINDSKYGWDRPDLSTLRLTLLHTPRLGKRFRYQRNQDLGRHRVRYALFSHAGSWSTAGVPSQAERFNQPLRAFRVGAHPGPLGRELSLLRLGVPGLSLRALKRAEASEETIIRLQHVGPAPVGGELWFGSGIEAARETDGAEQPLAPLTPDASGALELEFGPYQLRTLALRPRPRGERLVRRRDRQIVLPFDVRATSADGERLTPGVDNRGGAIPAELWPAVVHSGGMAFHLGPRQAANAMTGRAQEIAVAAPANSRIALLCASMAGDRTVAFAVGEARVERTIPDWGEFVGQWDRRSWLRWRPGYLKRTAVAWVATHRHTRARNEPYQFCYLFRVELPVSANAAEFRLPYDEALRVFAVTVVEGGADAPAIPAAPLYD